MNIGQLFSAIVLSAATLTPWAANPKPFTVPEVSSWKGAEGTFNPQNARIVAEGASMPVARLLSQDYEALTNSALPLADDKNTKGNISLQIKKNKKENPEAYTIKIEPDGISLTAPSEQGLYWATRTLLQIVENSVNGTLPTGTIDDCPSFGLRGFMIDAGRKYMPLDYLYALVNTLSYYKINTLAIHLNDNCQPKFYDNDWDKVPASFRLECETFPGLTARDGSYTKQEFRDLQKYALARGIEIIPEIDVPAHSLAFTRYRPELASTSDNGRDHFDIAKPETYSFLDSLFTEYLQGPDPVFSGKRFNIGTDEYNGDAATMEKFRAFTDRYARFVESFGKQPVVWGSLTHAKGKTPVKSDNVLMMCWSNSFAKPKDMVEQGFDIVSIPDRWVYIVPKVGYYHDYLDTEWLYNNWTPANVGGDIFSGKDLDKVKGGMFALWNDTPNNGITVKDIAHHIKAALPTMAAKTWNAEHTTVPYDEFNKKAQAMTEAPGINFLARHGRPGETVLELADVAPGSKLPLEEMGYDYSVEFDLDCATEVPGTKLFESPHATFWLSDPITGQMGFSRDGQLSTFRHIVKPGEKIHVKVTGDKQGTQLYVDGRLVDDLNEQWINYYKPNAQGKREPISVYLLAQMHTLVFPLDKAGNFKSKVYNLEVVNKR